MAREGRLRSFWTAALIFSSVVALFHDRPDRRARADAGGVSAASACPDADAVWSSITKMVPNAATELLAARPRVQIVDLGDRYRVRVSTAKGVLERTYSDPARMCAKRTRFAAEFVVLALMPPVIDDAPVASPSASAALAPPLAPIPSANPAPASAATAAPTAPSPSLTTDAPAPPAPHPPPPVAPAPPQAQDTAKVSAPSAGESRPRPPIARVEISAIGEAAAPLFGTLGVWSWGGDLRVRIGRGPIAAVVGAGYRPQVAASSNGVQVALTRVPMMAGVRLGFGGGAVEWDGDFGLTLAVERYDGVDFHLPLATTRIAPGASAALTATWPGFARFAPFVTLQCALYPWVQDLSAVPEGDFAKTPSLWVGVGLGLSLAL